MKFLKIAIALVLAYALYTGLRVVLFGAAAAPSQELPQWAAQAKADYPKTLDSQLTMTGVTYENDRWSSFFSVADDKSSAAKTACVDTPSQPCPFSYNTINADTFKAPVKQFLCADALHRRVLASDTTIQVYISAPRAASVNFEVTPADC